MHDVICRQVIDRQNEPLDPTLDEQYHGRRTRGEFAPTIHDDATRHHSGEPKHRVWLRFTQSDNLIAHNAYVMLFCLDDRRP